VRPFTVRQPDGGTVTLPEHAKDAKAVVVVFVSFECPVAKSYFAPLGELAKAYAAKGVAVVAVCPDEGAAEVKTHAAEFKLPVPPAGAKVTFYKDVLPVLQNRCQECHRPGEVGPFSLLAYKQAVRWGDLIKDYTARGAMPPWKPAGGPAYLHDRRMPKAEVEL